MRFSFDFNDTPHRIYGIWPMTPFPLEVSIYGVCAHSCAYCVPPETKITMADLSHKQIGDIKIGDTVLGWGQDNEQSKYRRFAKSTVEQIFRKEAPIYRITLDDAPDVYCTADHYWYTGRPSRAYGRGKKDYEYQPLINPATGLLYEGAKLLRLAWYREAPDTDIMSEDYALGYIRGYAEGDGTYLPQRTWRFASTDLEPLLRLKEYSSRLFGLELPEMTSYPKVKESNKDMTAIILPVSHPLNSIINGFDLETWNYWAGWLGGMYDAEGSCSGALRIGQSREKNAYYYYKIERALRILGFGYAGEEKAIRLYGGHGEMARFCAVTRPAIERKQNPLLGESLKHKLSRHKVLNAECVGTGEVVAMRTSTHNYIAGGYFSRNCFSNLGRAGANRKPHTKNSLQTLINGFERARRDEYSPIGFFLREKYPICFSNTTDPFMPQEKAFRCSEAFMKYAKANGLPLFIQTKGGILYEERERYIDYLVPGKDVVYMTLTTLDDELIKKIEPGAPTATERLKLTEYLASHDIPVILAPNPYVKDWIPNEKEYCRIAKDAGARGIWQTHLHLNGTQREVLARENDPLDLAHLVDKVDAAHMNRQVKDWYIAAESVGLDIYTNQNFAPYFGNREKHEEAANPAWLGGKVFDYVMKIPKFLNRLAYRGRSVYDEDFKPVTPDYVIPYSWGGIEALLRVQNCPNPTLNVSDFWYPYNTKIGADRQEFAHTLGKRNTLYNILRYFFNHPWENNAFSFTHMHLITVGDNGARMVLDNGDMIYTFYPFNRYEKIQAYDGYLLDNENPPKGEYLFLDSITDEDMAYLWGEYMS